ncbi:MAG: glycosyltransferase family 2 protein [Bacteroidia bacterium]|nr:glycosyltransferase family 2 protein [Bacteroidia bacterium]
MFVSGFTIVRNAIKYDYPVKESIESILPLCDEVIVLVGNSDDGTRALIESIGSAKIKIHQSIWNDALRVGGKVLAVETDKAFKLINPKADWCIYIQADEVIHEQYHKKVLKAMQTWLTHKEVEGLLFGYKHFFGNFNYLATSRSYYRNEIRVIRNNPAIISYRDAQGFRKNGEKLNVKPSEGQVYHYGWVRHPDMMRQKIKNFHQLWHNDDWIDAQENLNRDFDYNEIDSVETFNGSHPSVMKSRIKLKNWDFKPSFNPIQKSFKKKLLFWLESKTGIRLGEYKNYKLL